MPSPTFTLVQSYQSEPCAIWHFDLYRISARDDAVELGIDDAFSNGISLVEWPDRLEDLLPSERIDIELAFVAADENARRAHLSGSVSWRHRLETIARAARER